MIIITPFSGRDGIPTQSIFNNLGLFTCNIFSWKQTISDSFFPKIVCIEKDIHRCNQEYRHSIRNMDLNPHAYVQKVKQRAVDQLYHYSDYLNEIFGKIDDDDCANTLRIQQRVHDITTQTSCRQKIVFEISLLA